MPDPTTPLRASLPSHSDLAKLFDSGTWQRGQNYANSGAVLWSELLSGPSLPGQDYEINGEVSGSESEPYEQDIQLSQQGNGRWKVVGNCTCPVGFNCKHVVALLLNVLDQDWFAVDATTASLPTTWPSPHDPLNQWLAQTENQIVMEEASRASGTGSHLGQSYRQSHAPSDSEHVTVLSTCRLSKGAGQSMAHTVARQGSQTEEQIRRAG